MDIQITFRKKVPGTRTPSIKRALKRVLKDLGCDNRELSILFTDDAQIRALNKKYRGKDSPTNVLAFPMTGGPSEVESGMLGDVVISSDTALRESEETDETADETVLRLLVHGLLHLLGYDHERSKEDEKIMTMEEMRLVKLIREDTDGAAGCKH